MMYLKRQKQFSPSIVFKELGGTLLINGDSYFDKSIIEFLKYI